MYSVSLKSIVHCFLQRPVKYTRKHNSLSPNSYGAAIELIDRSIEILLALTKSKDHSYNIIDVSVLLF